MTEPKKDTLQAALKDAEAGIIQYERNSGKDEAELLQERREARETAKRLRQRGDVQQVLKIVEVRRVLWRILELCGPYQPSFDPTSARQTDFNEGKRDIGLRVLNMIMDADPAAYLQLANEHQSDLKAEAERIKKENNNNA